MAAAVSSSTLIALDDASTLPTVPDFSNASSSSPPPPKHIGPVSSAATDSYDPAVLARTTLNGHGNHPDASSLPARARTSVEEQSDDDDDPWDDWGNDGPSSSSAGLQPQANGFRRRSEEDEEEDGAAEREMKDLDDAGGHGGRMVDHKLRKELYWRHVAVTGIFVALWYGFSTAISLYNKWVFGPKYFGFPFPMFMTFCQMLVQFSMAGIVRYTMPDKFKPPNNPSLKDYGMRVTPTGVSTALDIGLSNLSLKTITLSLYTMCKSSTLIFVLIFAFIFRLEAYSLRLVSVIGLITAGVFLMAYNTTAVSIPGAIMVFAASVLGGLRWALTHTLMIKPELGMTNPFATIFWITPMMAATLAIVSMATDGWGNVFGSEFFQDGRALQTIPLIILPGVLAFSMVACEYYIIQRAGIVPLSVAGVFKEVTTISIASWAFGDELTPVNFAGLFVTMIGIGFFTHHKYEKSMQEPHGHGHEPHLTSTQDEESHPLTSRSAASSSHARGDSSAGSGGFWGFLRSNRVEEDHDRTPYQPITVFSEDEPGLAAADSGAVRESARERYERGGAGRDSGENSRDR